LHRPGQALRHALLPPEVKGHSLAWPGPTISGDCHFDDVSATGVNAFVEFVFLGTGATRASPCLGAIFETFCGGFRISEQRSEIGWSRKKT
jgi:hypothetical protein